MTELSFSALPPALPAYGRLVLPKSAKRVELREPISAIATKVRADAGKLRAYRKVCAIATNSGLPLCYPQVMAYPLHLNLLGHRQFPLAAMGLVHLANRIEQTRLLGNEECFDLRATIARIEDTPRGYEFELLTEIIDRDGDIPWRGMGRILSRKPVPGDGSRRTHETVPSAYPELANWSLAANMGRRYARVSGDFNPIHLSAVSARLLGFKRAIVHGMWTLARSISALPVAVPPSCQLDAQFKTPLFLPGQARLHGAESGAEFCFEVRNAPDDRPILTGVLS